MARHRSDDTLRAAVRKNLWWAGLVATLAAVMATVAVREIAVSMVLISEQFSPIDTLPVVVWTIAGALGAVFTFWYLVPRSEHPTRTFGLVVLAVLVLSFLPNLWLFLSRPYPGTTNSAVLSLMAMHVATAVVCYVVLAALVAWVRYFRE